MFKALRPCLHSPRQLRPSKRSEAKQQQQQQQCITRAMNFHFENKCKYLNCIRDSHRHSPKSQLPLTRPQSSVFPVQRAPRLPQTLRLTLAHEVPRTCTLNHSFYKQINYVLQENSQNAKKKIKIKGTKLIQKKTPSKNYKNKSKSAHWGK